MSFVTVPGLKGKVYVPQESRESPKKHPCMDCFACQHCSDDRCRVCLRGKQSCCIKGLEGIQGSAKVNPQYPN